MIQSINAEHEAIRQRIVNRSNHPMTHEDYEQDEIDVINWFLYPGSVDSGGDYFSFWNGDEDDWDGDQFLELFEEYEEPPQKSYRARNLR